TMEHSAHRDRKRSFANGPWTEEDCVGRILLQPRPEHRDIASVISCVVAFRCAAHDSISGLVHELGCRDLPSDGFRVSKPVARLFRGPHTFGVASADARSE